MRMLNETIAVTVLKEGEEKTQSGLIAVHKKPFQKGVVAEVPASLEDVLRKGEVVVFPAGSGQEMVVDGTEYLFLPAHVLQAVL